MGERHSSSPSSSSDDVALCLWRAASGVLCDKKVPSKLKGKFDRATIRYALLYGSECWAMMKALECKLVAAEMRMLRGRMVAQCWIGSRMEFLGMSYTWRPFLRKLGKGD
ncbi:hypothetical protein OROHE_005339 [Orobanche hederae]